MKPDLDQFLEYLDEYDLSVEQKQELLASLWMMIQVFVDLGFGVDATQNAIFAKQMNPSKDAKDSLRFKFNENAKQDKVESSKKVKPSDKKGVRHDY